MVQTEAFIKIEDSIYSSLNGERGAAYDNKAKTYEKLVGSKLYNRLMWGTLPSDYIAFTETALVQSKGLCLDIGCGGLVQNARLYSATKNEMVLLDNSIEMLKIGKERIEKLCNAVPENIRFVQGDAFSLPFAAETFDSVFSFGVLHIFEEKQRFIDEAFRVLKPGGKMFMTSLTPDRPFSRWYIDFLKKQGEFATPSSAGETLELFARQAASLNHYVKGSMIFISAEKR